MSDVPTPLAQLLRNIRDIPEAASARDRVNAIQAVVERHPEATKHLPITHHFAPGIYARELFIPADMIVIGKIHKYKHRNFLLAGEMTVLVEEDMRRLVAPKVVISLPGAKRIAYTHTDCRWLTVHDTDETDIAKLEKDLVADTEQEYLDFCRMMEAETPKCLS